MANTLPPSVGKAIGAKLEISVRPPLQAINRTIVPATNPTQNFAPAWFYSALNWLGRQYYDGNNTPQAFGQTLIGSDVNPYASLGSTCLFKITSVRGVSFRLAVAADANSAAGDGSGLYSADDQGIASLYSDLSASSIFPLVRFCYIPGLIGADVNAVTSATLAALPSILEPGYDPATGLRVVVQGSAVSQIVPLDDFQSVRNEQIYNEDPQIVPVVSALVYDITENNEVGAKTFFLPVFYSRDRIDGTFYVNRFGGATAANAQQPQCGQTAIFAGGPGYDDSSATALTLESTSGGSPNSTYVFDEATIVSASNPGTEVNAGAISLTYSGNSPAAIFASQNIVGFYRESAWEECFGLPIYDYGANNSSFTMTAAAVQDPVVIYDPAAPSLNGGSLSNVIRSLQQASYLVPPDQLADLLQEAATARESGNGVGLSVTTAALEFNVGSQSGAIVDQLSVPVIATFTTTPDRQVVTSRALSTKAAQSAGAANPATRSSKSTKAARAKKAATASHTARKSASVRVGGHKSYMINRPSRVSKSKSRKKAAPVKSVRRAAPATRNTAAKNPAKNPAPSRIIRTAPKSKAAKSVAPPKSRKPTAKAAAQRRAVTTKPQAKSRAINRIPTVSIVGDALPPTRIGVVSVGAAGNTAPPVRKGPVTTSVALTATIPQESLSGTGISSIEFGTPFATQALGEGRDLQAAAQGVVVNLMDSGRTDATIPPFDLATALSGITFASGEYYVLSLSGGIITVRPSSGDSQTIAAPQSGAIAGYTYVGAMVYTADTATVRMYPKLQLSLAAPGVGSYGVLQGERYNIRLTIGANGSVYDITDSKQSLVDSNIPVPTPVPTDKSNPEAGDIYFGSFVGGVSQMTVWSLPIFLTVVPSQLPGVSFDGTVAMASETSEAATYDLKITDSSLFIYSNINVDTWNIGSVSANNVYLASAVINSAPDDATSQAFAPCKLLMGLVRQVQVGTGQQFVFIPEDDSVIIGGARYMLSVINLGNLTVDPNSRPYPPVCWPQTQYWQFANRHNPYLDVQYTGDTQDDRIQVAQTDIAGIGLKTSNAQEPMQMYIDTGSNQMTTWPIYAFPFQAATQSVDTGQLGSITQTILQILKNPVAIQQTTPVDPALDDEKISIPSALQQANPYTQGAAVTADVSPTVNNTVAPQVLKPSILGKQVASISADRISSSVQPSLKAQTSANIQQAQQAASDLAAVKPLTPSLTLDEFQPKEVDASATASFTLRSRYQPIYGFTVFNPGTGEAYIIEVVDADLTVPDQLPGATENVSYDPYYVRVVFLNTLTCYNMSIIVPSMVFDQDGHLAQQGTGYQNLLSKTDMLKIGYMYSLYDAQNNFDQVNVTLYSPPEDGGTKVSESYLFTNLQYQATQTAVFDPGILYLNFAGALQTITFQAKTFKSSALNIDTGQILFDPVEINIYIPPRKPVYFFCRRQNWSSDCHLMQAAHTQGTAVYMAFGGGDIVPLRLDASTAIDKRQPDHMYKFTNTFADLKYDAVRIVSVANQPYVVGVTTQNQFPQYSQFSISDNAGTSDLLISSTQRLQFPAECYVVGQASTTLTSIDEINTATQPAVDFTTTGDFANLDAQGNLANQQYQLIAYNNLIYMIRAVSNAKVLGAIGGLGVQAGLLIDTFVPTASGGLGLAQGARYKRSGLQFFGSSYTPTTMVDSLDTLDFTSITGDTFYAPTIFIPIPELDASKGIVADLSNFIGQQMWTFVYAEIVAQPGATVNQVAYTDGFNLDVEGKPVLSLQKLHFVYDPLAVLFTPNDLTHKYPLQPKQQILALTNGQIQEGICWRSANPQPQQPSPTNVCAQQVLPEGDGMDRPNIIYSSHNRPIDTSANQGYLGMSVYSIRGISGVVYSIEESAFANDQTGSSFISTVSSDTNMLISVLFDYDNNDLGNLTSYNEDEVNRGFVFLNGYLGANGYLFSSPDHFDVNDVLPFSTHYLEQVTNVMGQQWDFGFYNKDVTLPRQYWRLVYDTFTAVSLPNYIANVPPSLVDPAFTNRTRSLVLNLQNPLRPDEIGLMDTYSSVVSANIHLQNGVTGSVFLSKKADREVASVGTNPAGASPTQPAPNTYPLYGLPAKYDFFIFSRDHYWTLNGARFELVDQGYAMYLVDDGTGTGNKVASYYTDSGGNYYELYNYVLQSPGGGIIETQQFILKVALGTPASPGASETPNNVNPQDLVAQINKLSNVIYAVLGPSSPGQPAAIIPIQAVGGPTVEVQAAPIAGAPGFNGYTLNVLGANHQPVQISQIYSGSVTYPIAGATTLIPYNTKAQKAVPFYGSISHGLDQQLPNQQVTSPSGSSIVGTFGGDGLGALINTSFSFVFQGSVAAPSVATGNQQAGSVMKADAVSYSYNAITNILFDSTNKTVTATGGQYFIDTTDPGNPIYVAVTVPKFVTNTNTYNINLSTTLPDGVTSRYSLVAGGKSYLFGPDNTQVTADRTVFTFAQMINNVCTVSYADVDSPTWTEAPSPVVLTPFTIASGGVIKTIDVFHDPGSLQNIPLGVAGRLYTYDPVQGAVTISQGGNSITVPLQTGLTFTSASGYGYVIAFANGQGSVNGSPMYPYNASAGAAPASYPLMTSPQMFTVGNNFYTFDRDRSGNYVTVTGNGQAAPVNPYQFSVLGDIFILNTSAQPNTVIGNGNTYTMTASNSQFLIGGVQYSIALKSGSLNGATVSAEFDITQSDVVIIENYVYQLDTPNGQIVGNGTAYPLTSSGVTYTIATADNSFTVTSAPNATTVTIGNEVYQINNTTVVGDGVTYPILTYRTFTDGAATYSIGFDGTAYVPATISLAGSPPYTRATFTDGGSSFTVNDLAAFDGSDSFLISGTPAQFTANGTTYILRADAATITNGASKTYLVNSGAPSPNQFNFGSVTIFFCRPQDVAAFDGVNYYAIVNNQFTNGVGTKFTLNGNTAVNEGNSYEIFSNFGQSPYFTVPGVATYMVNVAVADTGSATGDIHKVFPITSGQFSIALLYTITIVGGIATVTSLTAPGGITGLTASGTNLTGGSFTDPVTNITYTCSVDIHGPTMIDSNNVVYALSSATSPATFTVSIPVTTGVSIAVKSDYSAVYPVTSGQFIADAATYVINAPVAYLTANAATGPYRPMVNARFTVPATAALASDVVYSVQGKTVTKGYVLSGDNQFSPDGDTVYTVNDVNVVKSTDEASLGTGSPQTVTFDSTTYSLDTVNLLATTDSQETFSSAAPEFTIDYNGLEVTYTVDTTAMTVTDSRLRANVFPLTAPSATTVSFKDTMAGTTFSFKPTGSNNPVTIGYVFVNDFFTDAITNVTFYIDETDNRVEAISYLPETTQYAFIPADGNTYLIDYNDVDVVFPVISGANVNAGIATVGSDKFTVHIDKVVSTSGGAAFLTNLNSFEINGNLYTIAGNPTGSNYQGCQVVGDMTPPQAVGVGNTFRLTDPNITYTLQLDENNLPVAVLASFPVSPSRDLISINDDIYLITYNTVSTGSLLGQGQASIAIVNSSFTLTNPFDSTRASFIFDDLNIYDAGAVRGQFTVYLSPTFSLNSSIYTLDTVNLIVTDSSKRPYPLLPNPTMFSISGANYVIDTNRTPHAIVGNNTAIPLSTDVTVQSGLPIPNTIFALGSLSYQYTEDSSRSLIAITGTRLYPVDAVQQSFKLDSSLVFAISKVAPPAGGYAGAVVPIGTIAAGTTILNLYAGIPQTGDADYFIYKNVLYTLIPSATTGYEAVQGAYPVYASKPTANQQQLAVFDLKGGTYIVTDGSTAGAAAPAGISPGTIWAQTSISNVETQFGVVYGFAAQPTNVTMSSDGATFQFTVADATGNTTVYNIDYTAGGNSNMVAVYVPEYLPTFTQTALFDFIKSYPLTFETSGYNAFTAFVDETNSPTRSFAAAYRTPVVSTSPSVNNIIGPQGDFSVEFWHSLSVVTPTPGDYHPFTFSLSNNGPTVDYIDVDFEDDTDIFVRINDTIIRAITTPPMLISGWRHFSLTYTQPYNIQCAGAGFEVKDGSNYDFERDFSLSMTFSLTATPGTQGLLYKGTGSANTPPHLAMSYRVTVQNGAVVLDVCDGTSTIKSFPGPGVEAGKYYELVIVKKTDNGGSQDPNNSDPYAPPFSLSGLATASVSLGNPPASETISSALGSNSPVGNLVSTLQDASQGNRKYTVAISVREVKSDGSFGDWSPNSNAPASQTTTSDAQLQVNPTASAHLLIGEAYDDYNKPLPLGADQAGYIRDLYLFNAAINRDGVASGAGPIPISQASFSDLTKAGLVGCWKAAYDPNGIVNNLVNSNDVAVATNASEAMLKPLQGHEFEGTTIYINGVAVPLELQSPTDDLPSSITQTSSGPLLLINAGTLKIQEISMWNMARQPYQVSDDMFGNLIPSNEPLLVLYLSAAFLPQDTASATTGIFPPLLPSNVHLDNVSVTNQAPLDLAFSPASLDLAGSPAVGRCGPLVSPSLYSPPGVALTVCDTPPSLTTYSVTLNSTTGTPTGEVNEAYVYIKDNVLTLYAGKKVGDLVLSWVSQEQGDVQIMGYIEGAPPAPMANLTNKASYAGATSVTFSAPTSVALKFGLNNATTNDTKLTIANGLGAKGGLGFTLAPFGAGTGTDKGAASINFQYSDAQTTDGSLDHGLQQTATNKFDQTSRYTVRLQGAMSPYTGDTFMATLNTLTVPSNTPGNPSSKIAILPNPNLGGFTTSNPPSSLPKTAPTEEKFGQRMFVPSPYGQAFVISQTLDVYQQTLVQSNTVYGFVRIPNSQIPPDYNIVSFRMSSKYLRPGCLDGMIGYAYNPAALANGTETYTTSTGELSPLYDGNFDSGDVAHNASYMRVVEAYQLKKQIDQQTFNALALYQTAYNNSSNQLGVDPLGSLISNLNISSLEGLPGPLGNLLTLLTPLPGGTLLNLLTNPFGALTNPLSMLTNPLQLLQFAQSAAAPTTTSPAPPVPTPGLDFYDEYVWSSRGGTHEIKHTFTTAFEQVYTASTVSSYSEKTTFNCKISSIFATILNLKFTNQSTQKQTIKYTYSNSTTSSFDITASFDGIEADTQMRYSSNNDAHFVMKYNSTFNPNNQSGLNLVIGSDGLVYKITPSVESGAGLPLSDNIDDSQNYIEPQPAYTSGNADGLSGLLEPYDRPGKTNLFRTYAFFLQPNSKNSDDFWNTVIDQNWLNNSPDADAVAMRSAQGNTSIPWRLLYRVTYSQRFLPPIDNGSTAIPQINPVMAVPVLNPVSDFLFRSPGSDTVSPLNPANDIEANVVLAAPTASGLSAGSNFPNGPNAGTPVPPNNVIPFDLMKTFATITSWGDSPNAKILTQLMTSILGQFQVVMSPMALPGSVKVTDVMDPVHGGVLYSVYTDPNGITVNVPVNRSINVMADVNGNPIQYFDGEAYHSLQSDYVASPDGSIMYYIQPPSTYDQTAFDLLGDYDLFGHPGDEWRYYLVSGSSANMTSQPTVAGYGPFAAAGGDAPFTGFTIADAQHDKNGNRQVQGFVLVQGVLQYPHLNVNAETFADVVTYKAMSLFDTFPIGDPEVLNNFLTSQYPSAPFVENPEIVLVFANNIISYFNANQQAALNPQ